MNFITNISENMMIMLINVYRHRQSSFENFYENKNLFDFSDYQEDSHFLILSIKKQLVK